MFQRKLDETTKLLRELQEAQNERLSTRPPPNMICLLGPSYREMHLGMWYLLESEPPGQPRNTGGGSLTLLQGIFPTQNQIRVSRIAGGLFTSQATRGASWVSYKK